MQIPRTLDITQLSVLAEIIIRGGDLQSDKANTKQILQKNYQVLSAKYGVYGLSVLLDAMPRHAASYDVLIQRNPIFNHKLSLSVIGTLKNALKHAGYGMILYITPSHDLPDHHTLAVFTSETADNQDQPLSSIHSHLPDAAANAIISAFNQVVDNPYPKPRPNL